MSLQAGLYLRISLDRTGEGLAVERQQEDGERLIELRGWTLPPENIFRDNDISAAGGKKRPGFETLLGAVARREVQVVVAWSLDRLTRNRRDQLRLIETCQQHGVNLALVRGADVDLSSAVGRGVADILSATARMEIEQKSERQIRANRQAAEKGLMVGGRRAFGYTPDGLHLDPAEAPVLAQMYHRFITGVALGSLARWLNDDLGIRTARGNRWGAETVRVVLANPRNAGLRASRTVDPATGVRKFFHDAPVSKAAWPAVVEETTWRRALKILQSPERRRSSTTRPRHLLSGIAYCGVCGEHVRTSWSGGVRTLRCSASRHLSRRADKIEAFVVETLLGRLRRRDAAALFPSPGAHTVDVDAVRERSAALRAELPELFKDFKDPQKRMSRDEYQANRQFIVDQLDELDTIVAEAGRVDVLAPLRAASDPEAVWDNDMTDETRREVIRQAMRVDVLSGRPGQAGGRRFQEDTVRILWL